jgi:hypothetical protein
MTEPLLPPALIYWTIRIFAVVFVLPFRVLWEALGFAGRILVRYVVRPLVWLWHYAVVVPAVFLWHYGVAVPAAFLWRYLIAVPVAFLWRYAVVVPTAWLWRQAFGPALGWLFVVPAQWLWQRRALVLRPLTVMLRCLIVIPLTWAWAVTAPLWRGLVRGVAWVLIAGWQGAGWVLGQVYRWLLRPAGLAVAWVWRHTIVPACRMIAAGGRWVGEAILRPAADATRAVLVSIGLRG